MRLLKRQKRLDWPLPPSGPAPRFRGANHRRPLFFKIMVVAVVFFIFLSVRETQTPWGVQVRDGLQYVLTTDWNYQPVVDRVVRLGLQTVNVDIPFLDSRPQPPDGETEMASGPLTTGDFTLPVSGTVEREFGWVVDPVDNQERFHPGLDIAAAAGTPVQAVLSGVVAQVGDNPAYGPFVLLEHGDETYTLYAQLDKIRVAKGDRVDQGQSLAEVGTKGDFPGPGVHFELREKGQLVDPRTRSTGTEPDPS